MADEEFMGQVFSGNDIALLVEFESLLTLKEKGERPLTVFPLVEKLQG